MNQPSLRFEYKYFLTNQQYKTLTDKISSFMSLDEYGLYEISSIYFDTLDFTLANKAISSPSDNNKIRLRKYGFSHPSADSILFLECKKKISSKTQKIRKKYHYSDFSFTKINEYLAEIELFDKVHPQIQINYNRQAYKCAFNHDIRLTIDQNVKATINKTDNYLKTSCNYINILPTDYYLLEIKFSETIPTWLDNILNELTLVPKNYSKYLAAYNSLISG